MKQVININFQGRVVPIEQTAYDTLRSYIESLHRFFAQEEGKEEIVNDIENRIGELFQQKLQDGSSCIVESDVEAVIKSMGRPADFEAEDMGGNTTGENAGSFAGTQGATFTRGQRLYRDENDKVLGGVCSGLAHYFNVDVVVVRVIFAILFFSFGLGFIPYIILWVVVPSTATQQIGSVRKRLFRDTENKYVAGVCSGLANYFGIKTWIPRLIFFIPLLSFISKWGHWGNWDFGDIFRFSFSPTALIIYVILWLVIPEAKTTSEKLEMKGEKVDMNSIKNSVKEEFKGVSDRATRLSSEFAAAATGASKNISSDLASAGRRGGSGLGRLISLFVKIILYTIAGSLLIALLFSLLGIAIASIGVFPLKDFILSGNWENTWAWGTLLFFIAVPIVGLITWIVRKFAKVKRGSTAMRATFICLWILGWISVTMLATSISRDFKTENRPQAQEVFLTNPGINKLEITSSNPDFEYNVPSTLTFQPFDWIEDDTALLHNVKINIFRSATDSFRVVMYKSASGASREQASNAASLIDFNIRQLDSALILDKGIKINKHDKFRNQRIIMNVYVPEGKQIRINDNIRTWGRIKVDRWGIHSNDDELYYENSMNGWNTNVDYIMKKDGLYTLDGLPADKQKFRERFDGVDIDENGIRVRTKDGVKIRIDDNGVNIDEKPDSNDSINNYRYNNDGTPPQKIVPANTEEMRKKDSLEKSLEKTKKELERINAQTGTTAMNIFVLPGYNPTLWLN